MLLKAEAFYSLPRLPETSFYSFYSKNLQDYSNSTFHQEGQFYFKKGFDSLHSFM